MSFLFLQWLSVLDNFLWYSMVWHRFLLFSVFALAVAGLRTASAATRHFVWLCAFIGVVVLPFAQMVLPEHDLIVAKHGAIGRLLDPHVIRLTHGSLEIKRIEISPGHDVSWVKRTGFYPFPLVVSVVTGDPPHGTVIASAYSPFTWYLISRFTLFWILNFGMLFFLTRFCAGLVLAVRIVQRCERATDEMVLALSAQCAESLGLRRAPILRVGDIPVPMTIGVFRPTILLPADSTAWPEARLRSAMMHEMAHIRRLDWLWQCVAELTCAVQWLNPLVWLALSRIRSEAEQACDDIVVEAGTPATDYAGHLVEVARSLRQQAQWRPATVAMVRSSAVETRVRAILTRERGRGPLILDVAIAATLSAVILVVLISPLRLDLRETLQERMADLAKAEAQLRQQSPATTAHQGASRQSALWSLEAR